MTEKVWAVLCSPLKCLLCSCTRRLHSLSLSNAGFLFNPLIHAGILAISTSLIHTWTLTLPCKTSCSFFMSGGFWAITLFSSLTLFCISSKATWRSIKQQTKYEFSSFKYEIVFSFHKVFSTFIEVHRRAEMRAESFSSRKPGGGRWPGIKTKKKERKRKKDSAKRSTGSDEKDRNRPRLHSSVYYAPVWISIRGVNQGRLIPRLASIRTAPLERQGFSSSSMETY